MFTSGGETSFSEHMVDLKIQYFVLWVSIRYIVVWYQPTNIITMIYSQTICIRVIITQTKLRIMLTNVLFLMYLSHPRIHYLQESWTILISYHQRSQISLPSNWDLQHPQLLITCKHAIVNLLLALLTFQVQSKNHTRGSKSRTSPNLLDNELQ